MRPLRILFLILAAVALASAASTVHTFPGPGSEFIVKEDLGVLPGDSESSVAAINA